MIKTHSNFKIDTVLLVFAKGNGNHTIAAPKIRGLETQKGRTEN